MGPKGIFGIHREPLTCQRSLKDPEQREKKKEGGFHVGRFRMNSMGLGDDRIAQHPDAFDLNRNRIALL